MALDLRNNVLLLGMNHHSAPVAVREKFTFPRNRLRESLSCLLGYPGIDGAVILFTCNRSEIYVSSPLRRFTAHPVVGFVSEYARIDPLTLSAHFYFSVNRDVVEHLFRVASGLDSQVLGENEILGQIKQSYYDAKDCGVTDASLNRLFQKAFRVGKHVRSRTCISEGSTSMSSTALKLAESRWELKHKKILLVGVNKINEQIAKYLFERSVRTVFVSNRTYEKARKLAEDIGGTAVHFDELTKQLAHVDVVISSTSAPHLILKKDDLLPILSRRTRQLLIIDLAVPRDVDPELRTHHRVVLHDLDDLKAIIDGNRQKKLEAAHAASSLIERAVEDVHFPVDHETSSEVTSAV